MDEERTEMSLQVVVNPGTAITNFNEFKQQLRAELDAKYSTIEVSEERLKEAKDARARLNRAKTSLKEAMKSAQLQNDEPLIVPKQQAKELDDLLGEYIVKLDKQIKEIEEKQRKLKMDEATAIMAAAFADASEEVCEIAVKCEWIKKPEWGNKTYSPGRIAKDSREAREQIEHALELFTGDFRPQMLADFIKYGNLAKSQLFGAQLQKQKEAYEAARKAKAAPVVPEVITPAAEEERSPESASSEQEQHKENYVIRVEATADQIRSLVAFFKENDIHGSIRKENAR